MYQTKVVSVEVLNSLVVTQQWQAERMYVCQTTESTEELKKEGRVSGIEIDKQKEGVDDRRRIRMDTLARYFFD